MKRRISMLGAFVALCAYGHASHKMHEADIFTVFAGYDTSSFRRVSKRISSGMDNELPRRFRAEIGPVPGNHRILGHCWTFGDAIPRRVLDAIEARHPGRKSDFIALWQTFANEVIDDVSQVTGLPSKQSSAVAALIHDVHLLGDRTPDNSLVDNVLTTEEIRCNIVKSAGIIWGRNSEVTHYLKDAGKVACASGGDEFTRAERLLFMMKNAGLGRALGRLSVENGMTSGIKKQFCELDSQQDCMVECGEVWVKAREKDIVRELIGRVKLLRVSRRAPSTLGRSNSICNRCKGVFRNVRSFMMDDTCRGKCTCTSSLRISIRAILTASEEIRKGGFLFCLNCRAA